MIIVAILLVILAVRLRAIAEHNIIFRFYLGLIQFHTLFQAWILIEYTFGVLPIH